MDGLQVDALESKLDGELCGPRFSHHKNDHLKKLITIRWISISKEVRKYKKTSQKIFKRFMITSVADPDPPDPHVFGPPGSGSINQRYGSGSGSFYHHAKIVRKTLISTIL